MLARELLAKVRKIEIKTRRLVDEITGQMKLFEDE